MANRTPNKAGVESRRRLLAAGVGEFHRVGYEAAGVDAITKSAGIPKGSFYNHFGSKEAFGAAVVDAFFEPLLIDLRSALEDEARPPRERLRVYFDRRIAALSAADHRGGCLLGNMSLEIADRSELLRERVAGHLRTWSRTLAECVREGQERGEIDGGKDAAALADFVLNSWQGAVLRAKASRSAAPLEIAAAMIFGCILVPGPALKRPSARAARRG